MDRSGAIETNRAALTCIVMALIAMVELTAEGVIARLPRLLYRTALGVLLRAESAARRLIVIAARDITVKPPMVRPMPAGLALKRHRRAHASFQLFDARKRFAFSRPGRGGPKPEPRISIFGSGPFAPLFQPQAPAIAEVVPDDGMVDAQRLGRRLQAIKAALENLQRQALRLKRWQARRDRMAAPKFRSPLRPGHPPGYRSDPKDDADRVLRVCHSLAQSAFDDDSS